MTLKNDLKAYKARWAEVEAAIAQERKSASLELRWLQLNAAVRLGKALELTHENHCEMEVIERWAKIKEKAANCPKKASSLF
jgi:hypothetical protein